MWGSSRFQAPEEYRLGAAIDEVTNVYTAGAFAFALFGGYGRTPDSWQLGEGLFAVAAKAVEEDRSLRQQSLRQFREEWDNALSGLYASGRPGDTVLGRCQGIPGEPGPQEGERQMLRAHGGRELPAGMRVRRGRLGCRDCCIQETGKGLN